MAKIPLFGRDLTWKIKAWRDFKASAADTKAGEPSVPKTKVSQYTMLSLPHV
jgi:hypothetical protein